MSWWWTNSNDDAIHHLRRRPRPSQVAASNPTRLAKAKGANIYAKYKPTPIRSFDCKNRSWPVNDATCRLGRQTNMSACTTLHASKSNVWNKKKEKKKKRNPSKKRRAEVYIWRTPQSLSSSFMDMHIHTHSHIHTLTLGFIVKAVNCTWRKDLSPDIVYAYVISWYVWRSDPGLLYTPVEWLQLSRPSSSHALKRKPQTKHIILGLTHHTWGTHLHTLSATHTHTLYLWSFWALTGRVDCGGSRRKDICKVNAMTITVGRRLYCIALLTQFQHRGDE